MTDIADLVRRSQHPSTRETFTERVDEQAATLRADVRSGALDNEAFTIGLELEVYAIDGEGRPVAVPDSVLDVSAKEIGRHNAELNTDPSPFDEAGLAAQEDRLRERVATARAAAREADLDLVLDALWTIPPAEGTIEYLGATSDEAGVTLATHMRSDARYHALDNDVLDHRPIIEIEVPGATIRVPTVFVESLATSMQPHLLVPATAEFPRYFNMAIRSLAPLLALSTNAPFLPADCYDQKGRDALDVIERTAHELRIPIFEESMNVASPGKVRVPRDLATAEEAVDRLLADRICAPFLREWVAGERVAPDAVADPGPDTDIEANGVDGSEDSAAGGSKGGYASQFWELAYKRSSYWRWVRPVFAGTPVEGACGERSLRIEFRALPTQPSVEDVCGLSVLLSGLLHGLVISEHPLGSLPWAAAEESFYDVVERGFDADLAWVMSDGTRATDIDDLYGDLFAVARRGLADRGIPAATIERYLDPMEARVETRTAPSDWKKRAVRSRVEAGADLETAIEGMQRVYIERTGTPFVEWL